MLIFFKLIELKEKKLGRLRASSFGTNRAQKGGRDGWVDI
jgi:hypothetical protein